MKNNGNAANIGIQDLWTGALRKKENFQRIELKRSPVKHKWEIQAARFFGYNETTLALLKGPDERHYLVRSAAYPYGNPRWDKSVLQWNYPHGKLHWNDFLDDLAGDDNDLQRMAAGLSALPFIPCVTDEPREEFEALAEEDRFLSRKDLAEKYGHEETSPTPPAAGGLISHLRRMFSKAGAPPLAPKRDPFLTTDLRRQRWYEDERFARDRLHAKEQFLTLEQVKDTIERISADFGVKPPRRTRLVPYKPDMKWDGVYYPETTEMMLAEHEKGVMLSTLLHEMAHHLDHTYVHDGEAPSAEHGFRFKRIHMHLMHHYAGIPSETMVSLRAAYGKNFPLTADDIVRRDFTERRTIDILPAAPETETGREVFCSHPGDEGYWIFGY